MEKCIVLVSSCDKYEDIWNPFFSLFQKMWPDNPYPVVLNTETKSCSYQGIKVDTLQLYQPGEQVTWSKRLRDHLRKINTEYVLILMEDFFINEPVDTAKIHQCIDWMDKDHSICSFDLYVTNHKKTACQYPGFMERPRFSQYRFQTEACIWRRTDLIHFLRDDEDPWIFEFMGNIRSLWTNKKFYVTATGETPIFSYETFAIVRGKWNKDRIDYVFKDNGIHVDYDQRGTISQDDVIRRTDVDMSWKHLHPLRVLHSYIVNIVKHPRSMFFDD